MVSTSHGSTVVQVGERVMSADGKQLGYVKEVREDQFKVDVRWAPDYWLGTESIDSSTDGIVQLDFTKDNLSSFKIPKYDIQGPGVSGSTADPGRPTSTPPAI